MPGRRRGGRRRVGSRTASRRRSCATARGTGRAGRDRWPRNGGRPWSRIDSMRRGTDRGSWAQPKAGWRRDAKCGVSTRVHLYRHDPVMERWRVPSARLSPRSSVYVAALALVAAVGFIEQSPWPIVVAAPLGLPASIVTLPCYYVVYGVLALLPGANPSSSTGSSSSDAYGNTLTTVTTGTPPAWFTLAPT